MRTPNGIKNRVPGIWLIYLMENSNRCYFFRKYRITISLLGNSSYLYLGKVILHQIWSEPCITFQLGGSLSFFKIYTVNWGWKSPVALHNFCWNILNHSLISFTLFLSLNTTIPTYLYIMWYIFEQKSVSDFYKGKIKTSQQEIPIHSNQLPTIIHYPPPHVNHGTLPWRLWNKSAYRVK